MKLVYPKEMTERQAKILNVCLSSPAANISRSQIKRSVAVGLPSIIPDARVVIENFAIPKLGDIDIIATDKTGRTIFVNICETLGGAELCRILGLADWMIENGELIQNFHPGIRAGLDSRQIIFAGEADGGAKSALARMTKGAPEVFEYNCAELGGEAWIILQKVEGASNNLLRSEILNPSSETRKMSKKIGGVASGYVDDFFVKSDEVAAEGAKLQPKEIIGGALNNARDKGDVNLIKSSARAVPRREFNLKSVLTQEEIGEFFDRPDNDEVTSRCSLSQV